MRIVAGIDVAKDELVIYVNGNHYTVSNTEKSLAQWLKRHNELLTKVDLFAFEPTGGYERILAKFLDKNDLPACRVHANHVRSYAKSLGLLAKTDKIDAKVIADFAEMKQLQAVPVIAENEHLIALMNRREQYIEAIKQERNRLETLDDSWIIKDIKLHIRQLEKRFKKLEKAIAEYVQSNSELKEKIELICTIPGVGFITAVNVVAYLPEIHHADDKQISALAGLAPMNQDSGKTRKKRKIQGGRYQIRRTLYMAALAAKRYNPNIKLFFNRLESRGKPFKVAITAAMRKLLLIIRSVINRGMPWQDQLPK